MLRARLLTCGLLLGPLACGSAPVNCDTSAAASLNVTVTDGAAGTRICDAVVTATDGAFSEQLMAVGPPAQCGYAGAYERTGTYVVSVSKTGFATTTRGGLVVTKDECHVRGLQVAIALDR